MISFTKIVLLLFLAYVSNTIYVIYTLFNPPTCDKSSRSCIHSSYRHDELSKLKVYIYIYSLDFFCYIYYIRWKFCLVKIKTTVFANQFFNQNCDCFGYGKLNLSWGRPVSYRNQSNDEPANQWAGFHMITAAVMKELHDFILPVENVLSSWYLIVVS